MRQSLLDEFLECSSPRCHEQLLPRDRVKKFHLSSLLPLLFRFIEECGFRPIPPVFCVMAVKAAYVVGSLGIAIPPQIFLHRRCGRAVRLGCHNAFITHDCRLLEFRTTKADEIGDFLE